MSKKYENMTGNERAIFWSDVAAARVMFSDPMRELTLLLRTLGREIYVAGIQDGKAGKEVSDE